MGNMVRGVTARDRVQTDNCDGAPKGLGREDDVVVVVLQDHPSPEISEPVYRTGEKLQVILQEAYWWRVRSLQTRKVDYIPNTHVAMVYHGWLFEGVERQKAEELLCLPGNRVGSFLVRDSTRERGVYSLSVMHLIVKHYRILRLANSWYYISPRLTFQCLEDLINHYSDFADGLCCTLSSPCLSVTAPPPDASAAAPHVVMRRNLDRTRADRGPAVRTESCGDSMLSYGVRSSIASYMSFSETQNRHQTRKDSRTKKSKSLYVLPEDDLANMDYDDEAEGP